MHISVSTKVNVTQEGIDADHIRNITAVYDISADFIQGLFRIKSSVIIIIQHEIQSGNIGINNAEETAVFGSQRLTIVQGGHIVIKSQTEVSP